MKRTCYAFMAAAVLTVTFVGSCGKQDAATTTQGTQAKENGALTLRSLVIKGWAADKTCGMILGGTFYI